MFRSRRSVLVKYLAKNATHEAPRQVETLIKRLEITQLEALALSVESRSAEETPCLLLPAGEMRLARGFSPAPPHVLFCRLWRWPDLRLPHELKRLPVCQSPTDPLYICANPYHWSRLYKPDSPPPPYSRQPQELLKLQADAPSEPVTPESKYTSHLSGCSDSCRPWCNIAYWELTNRVGRLLPVRQPAINVFADLPHGDGICLETLAQSNNTKCSNPTAVSQTRAKIGFGVTIFREENDREVWVYNRSEYPVFVNSPTLDPPNTAKLTVYKVQPGYSIKIFDYETSQYNQQAQDPSLLKDGPFDPHAVRISFTKGWGPHYSRRFITSCPCWLEVMFLVNR